MKYCFFILIGGLFMSCSRGFAPPSSQYDFHAVDGQPIYSQLDFWAAHPDKKDPSDSLPRSLRNDFVADTSTDIFFIYPTSYTDKSMSLGYNAPADDAGINTKTDYNSILYQASVFNSVGRIFSPRYRQANYWCYFPKDTIAATAAFKLAYQDVKDAFEYYLANYNHGRPIIIASHSQGTTHAVTLLKEFFDGKPLQQQLVAAYITGMPVTANDFTSIKPCSSPAETGCFCSWRTLRTNYTPSYIENEKVKAVVTNPLSWDTIHTSVSRKQNPGSVLRKFDKVKRKVAGATIHDGMLWTNRPHFFGSIFIPIKNYHIADYNFYYMSIRQNAKLRAETFLKNK